MRRVSFSVLVGVGLLLVAEGVASADGPAALMLASAAAAAATETSSTCDGVVLSTTLCIDGAHPAQPVDLLVDGALKKTWLATYCPNAIEGHSACISGVADVDLRTVRIVVNSWTPLPNPAPPLEAVMLVGIGGIRKNKGAEPRYIPMNGLKATSLLPAFPVYKFNGGVNGSTSKARCVTNTSLPPEQEQGVNLLARGLCKRSWGCDVDHFERCGDHAFVDFGNNSSDPLATPKE
jgi:hypothetical protein